MPDGKAREFTFVMEAKSVITKPSGGQKLLKQGFNEISGLAWSGNGRIQRVDVSTDAGKTWREARIDGPVQTRAVVRFTYPWSWNGGPAILQSRAVDETGYVQPTRSQIISLRGINSRYHYNAIQSWGVNSNGEVSNVQV
jgi:sulfane dehydrogenase subunit SoxC